MMITQTLQQIRDALSIIEDPAEALASIYGDLMALSLHRAREHFEAEAFHEAIYESDLYLLLVQKDRARGNLKDWCLAYALRGKAHYHRGFLKAAITDLNMIKDIFFHPNTAATATEDEKIEVLTYLGNAYLKSGELQKAMSTFKAGLEKRPDDPTLLYNFATACLQMGDARADDPPSTNQFYQQAIDAFTDALSVIDNADNRYNRGCAYFKSQDFESAEEDFDAAIKHNPEEARFYYNRAMARLKLGRRDAQGDLANYKILSGETASPNENGELR